MTELGPSVSMFGSARLGTESPYYAMAKEMAKKIAGLGLAVITGGGPGLMDAANEGAQQGGGVSCGISIDLPKEPEPNGHIDPRYRLRMRYFFVRKVLLVRYAQAFVVLPGGLGTLDELFEALTLVQTRKVKPFPIILMGKAYWSGLLDWMKATLLSSKTIEAKDLELFHLTDDPDEAMAIIAKHCAQQHKLSENF